MYLSSTQREQRRIKRVRRSLYTSYLTKKQPTSHPTTSTTKVRNLSLWFLPFLCAAACQQSPPSPLSVIHDPAGVRYKVGDVFSIRGNDRLYYVCIKSFMEDPLCHQYAVVIWLLPLYPDPAHYSPTDFLLGPAEDVPRPMDCLSFVSHDPPQVKFWQAANMNFNLTMYRVNTFGGFTFISNNPQGHITLNELQCYEKIPDLFAGGGCRRCERRLADPAPTVNDAGERSGLELLLEAMGPDIDQTNR